MDELLRRGSGLLRSLVRDLRSLSERRLHRLRRRAARRALRRRSLPRLMLVVCQGNVCRSPFAAELFRRALSQRGVRVESAGFLAPGRPSPLAAVAAAARRGVDLTAHWSRPLTPEAIRAGELVIVMDAAQRRTICDAFGRAKCDTIILGDLDPLPIATRTIRDPVDEPQEIFEVTYARIERCALELAKALTHPAA